MVSRNTLTVALISLICGTAIIVCAQQAVNGLQPVQQYEYPLSILPGHYAADGPAPSWASAPWLADPDAAQAVNRINELADKHSLTMMNIEVYKLMSFAKGDGSVPNAAYLYALYRGHTVHLDVDGIIQQLEPNFVSRSPQVSREYARSLFLSYAMSPDFNLGYDYWMVNLGNRLLNEDPHDYDVMYGVVDRSRPSTSPAMKSKMLALANTMIVMRPSDERSYNAEYAVYMPCFLKTVFGDAADADGAIRALRKRIEIEYVDDPGLAAEDKDIIKQIIILRDQYAYKKDPGIPQAAHAQPSQDSIPASPTPPQ